MAADTGDLAAALAFCWSEFTWLGLQPPRWLVALTETDPAAARTALRILATEGDPLAAIALHPHTVGPVDPDQLTLELETAQ